MNRNGQDSNVWAQVSRYVSLAMLLPISTLIGYVMGYLLDKLFHTHFLYVIFLFLGIAAGTIELIKELQKDSESSGS